MPPVLSAILGRLNSSATVAANCQNGSSIKHATGSLLEEASMIWDKQPLKGAKQLALRSCKILRTSDGRIIFNFPQGIFNEVKGEIGEFGRIGRVETGVNYGDGEAL